MSMLDRPEDVAEEEEAKEGLAAMVGDRPVPMLLFQFTRQDTIARNIIGLSILLLCNGIMV